jgi:hypothetical protein
MNRVSSRLPHILLASAFALSAFAAPPATAAGKRMYKPYTVTTPEPVQPGPVATATPAAQSAACTNAALGPVKVASDPEEGGQIAKTASPTEIKVTKPVDTASAKLSDAAPAPSTSCGSVQH